jgi:photosystem II stability/assembly factor-like uncharacterized protein
MKALCVFCCFLFTNGALYANPRLSPLTGHWQQIAKLDGAPIPCGHTITPGAHLPPGVQPVILLQLPNALFTSTTNINCGAERITASSSDNGASWSPLVIPSNFGGLRSLGAAGDTLYAFGDSGFATSKDGKTWGPVIPKANCTGPFESTTKGVLVSCLSTGFWRSQDNGITWTAIPIASLPTGPITPSQLIVTGDILFSWNSVSVSGPKREDPRFFRSADLGASWDEVGGIYEEPASLNEVFGRINLYARFGSPTHPSILLVSTDQGKSWDLRVKDNQVTPNSYTALEYSDSRLCTFNQQDRGGVYCSGDAGLSWQWLTKGLPHINNGFQDAYPSGKLIPSNQGMFLETSLSNTGNFDAIFVFKSE